METESIGQYFKNNKCSLVLVPRGSPCSGRLSFLTPHRIQAAAATYVRTGTLAVESALYSAERDVDVNTACLNPLQLLSHLF